MEVIVYVEGNSDRLAMEALLVNLVEKKKTEGKTIIFRHISPSERGKSGDGKENVLIRAPKRAAETVRNKNSYVVALPDLYPPNKHFPHTTFMEMEEGIIKRFREEIGDDDYELYKDRFKVFCFKFDLEALLLAAEVALKSHLGINSFPIKWTKPVEDQNHDNPPKRIVESLFEKAGKKYDGTHDAPLILRNYSTRYHEIANQCPQHFKRFVDFLESL